MAAVPDLIEGQTPNVNFLAKKLDFDESREDFKPFQSRYLVVINARLTPPSAGEYEFQITSDDGSKLWLDGKEIIDNDGLHAPESKTMVLALEARPYLLKVVHFEEGGGAMLRIAWRPLGAAEFQVLDESVLSTPKGVVRVTAPGRKRVLRLGDSRASGDRRPLSGVHPSYDLADLRPEGFEPKVGGMDLRPDGKLVICTWSPEGGVYLIDGVHAADPKAVNVKRIAAGLAEPLGLKCVGKRLFVLQKQELTELIDHDGDDVIDEYKKLADAWSVSNNFHEFAFGLVEKDGWLYFNLATAINPGGASTHPQVPDRGRTIRVNIATGEQQFLTRGLRTPNGIGIGVDGEIFIADNQGDWLPSSKILHLKEGAFYNSFSALPKDWKKKEATPPVVWLPQNEIGNSPSQPGVFKAGPFVGQMLHGDVTHGGMKRVFVERMGGEYQGAVFRFTQGLEAGINRFVSTDAGVLFVGGVGNPGNWEHAGRKWFGLQRLSPNGRPSFEMKTLSARSDGFVIEFTEPMASDVDLKPEDIKLISFHYRPTKTYGGPKIDKRIVAPSALRVSKDRLQLFVGVEAMTAGKVYQFTLPVTWRSVARRPLWSTEAWYTLNRVPATAGPKLRGGLASTAKLNAISVEESAAGWHLLFDGKDTSAWRGFRKKAFPTQGWSVENGELRHHKGQGGGDIITREIYRDFEFSCEWKAAPGANSGIFYRVSEKGGSTWSTGPEMQILDDLRHQDGGSPLTSAGALYAMIAGARSVAMPADHWNHARIKVQKSQVEHWLNGTLVVSYTLRSPQWYALKSKSKFKDMAEFGEMLEGHIALQDHGDLVSFRNLKIRRL